MGTFDYRSGLQLSDNAADIIPDTIEAWRNHHLSARYLLNNCHGYPASIRRRPELAGGGFTAYCKSAVLREVTRERGRSAYIILDVEYDPATDYGRSLAWIAPEISEEPGLTMTEDTTEDEYDLDAGDYPNRKWAGVISRRSYDALAASWSLDPEDSEANLGMLTEYGLLPGLRFNFSGMDWNVGGETPIAYASLSVMFGEDD